MVERRPVEIGKPYGRWTVISEVESADNHHRYYRVRCQCGTERTVRGTCLQKGASTSCGCISREWHLKHGKTETSTYEAWCRMKARCLNPNLKDFKNYGGRGITVCERWVNSFENFLADMGERPDGMMLERVNNEEGYSPDNCKWATRLEQANNKRNSRLLTAKGVTMTTAQWSRKLGVNRSVFDARLRRGWSDEQTVITPIGGNV